MTKGKCRFAVRRSPTGLGLFALEPIAAGKRIIEYTGPVITSEEADRKGGKYLMTIDDKYVIDGTPRSNTARYTGSFSFRLRNKNLIDATCKVIDS